ncbi:MAG TPA: DUF3343 domain-containing protein [Candidatus Obscuribacterales bacterium]
MARLILTFNTLFQVLAADKLLRRSFACRPTPTPPGITDSICGMSLELLDLSQQDAALACLEQASLPPNGVHELD